MNRFELSWDDELGYRVSVPNLLKHGERIEVMPVANYQRDVLRLAQETAELRATCNRLLGCIGDATRLLSPGMKAGVGEAKAILTRAIAEINQGEPG